MRRRLLRAAVVIGVSLIGSACSGADPQVDTMSADAPSTSGDSSGSKLAESSATSPTTTAPSKPNVTVVEVGMAPPSTTGGESRGTAGAVVRNDGTIPVQSVEVVFTFTDTAGTATGTDSAMLLGIAPGESAVVGVQYVLLRGEAVKVTANAVANKDSFFSRGGLIPVTVDPVKARAYGGFQITGTASNPGSSVLKGTRVDCVLRSSSGIVGYTFTYADTIVPGASVAWSATAQTSADPQTAQCSASVRTDDEAIAGMTTTSTTGPAVKVTDPKLRAKIGGYVDVFGKKYAAVRADLEKAFGDGKGSKTREQEIDDAVGSACAAKAKGKSEEDANGMVALILGPTLAKYGLDTVEFLKDLNDLNAKIAALGVCG